MSLGAQCLSVLLQSFSRSWKMFCVMFLFIGASQISIYISAFVLGRNIKSFHSSRVLYVLLKAEMPFIFLVFQSHGAHWIVMVLSWTGTEVLSKTMRVLFTTLGAFLFYCIGYMTLPWIAYGIREWRTLLAVLSATSVVYIPLWWYVSHNAYEVS